MESIGRIRTQILVVVAVVLLIAPAARAQIGPVFSLDDDPQGSIVGAPLGFGLGAEDPFGFVPPGLAPSPTLPAIPAADSEILMPGPPPPGSIPAVNVAMSPIWGQGYWYVNGVSENVDACPQKTPDLHLAFSVDRITRGAAGTAVNTEFGFNQQPGDVYWTSLRFTHPIAFVGTPPVGPGFSGVLPTAGTGPGTNFMIYDESALSLTPGGPPGNQVPPGVAAPPILKGTHDNTDAVNWNMLDTDGDLLTNRFMYWTANPDEATMLGDSAATVWMVPPNAASFPPIIFAPQAQLGLDLPGPPTQDDVDALVVWEDPAGVPGVADPQLDFALFSLGPGSASLLPPGLTAADIFFTDFNGSFWLYARDTDLGLLGAPGGEPWQGDNVDALEILVPGDADLDRTVNINDFFIFAANFGGAGNWLQADFDGNNTININDFFIFAAYFNTCADSSAPQATPEPMTLGLVAAGGAAMLLRRRRISWRLAPASASFIRPADPRR